jgi:hypothetical protein
MIRQIDIFIGRVSTLGQRFQKFLERCELKLAEYDSNSVINFDTGIIIKILKYFCRGKFKIFKPITTSVNLGARFAISMREAHRILSGLKKREREPYRGINLSAFVKNAKRIARNSVF